MKEKMSVSIKLLHIFSWKRTSTYLLGVVSEVYPEYMTDYAQRLVNLYIGALKAEVSDILFLSWLAEQEVRGSIPGFAVTISEIGYLLLPSRNMAERWLKWRKSSKQPTNQQLFLYFVKYIFLLTLFPTAMQITMC